MGGVCRATLKHLLRRGRVLRHAGRGAAQIVPLGHSAAVESACQHSYFAAPRTYKKERDKLVLGTLIFVRCTRLAACGEHAPLGLVPEPACDAPSARQSCFLGDVPQLGVFVLEFLKPYSIGPIRCLTWRQRGSSGPKLRNYGTLEV
jgi:hypothetical protein